MSEQTKEAVEKTKKAAAKKNKEMEKKEQPYLEKLRETLRKEFPKEAEQKKKVGGLTLTGYKPAYIIERLNLAFGYRGWYALLLPIQYKVEGQDLETQIMIRDNNVTVWVSLTVTFADTGKVFSHNQFGSCDFHKGMSIGDAMKGAYTDGLKKCAGYFDIGQEAYKGNVDPYFENNKGAKQQREKPFSGETRQKPGDYARGASPARQTITGVSPSEDKPTEKQIKFLQQHKIEVPKTKTEASKLIGERFKEIDARKTEGTGKLEEKAQTEAKRLSQTASYEQKNQIAYYGKKYPDVMQETLKGLELENTKGLTVKGADLVINKAAETLSLLGILPENEITRIDNE